MDTKTVDKLNDSGWCLYVLANDAGHTYIGITKGDDPSARIAQHNEGKGAKRTRGQGPWRLIHLEIGLESRSHAQTREWFAKKDRSFRAALRRKARSA